MANFIDFNLTFTDNSSGVRAEDGTEIQIYSDSPSFVPNVVVDHAYATHAWMSLPLVGAGITTVPIKLETPLTHVKVRVRQFNENGYGPWNLPGGGAGELFRFDTSSAVDAPDAPSNVGLVVVSTVTPPVDPPVDPPPDPPPVDGGTGTTNYSLPAQFSGTQGSSGWSYKSSDGADLTYDTASAVWRHASQAYLTAWSGGMHPGPTLGTLHRFTVPNTGMAVVTGNVNLYTTPGGGMGSTYVVKHNATTKFTQSMTDTTVYQLVDQIVASFAVTAGDTIDFILTSNQVDNSNMSTQATVNIALTSGGTPTNPVVSNITPATVSAYTGTVNSVRVSLSSAAIANSTISLSSTNGAIASVPASIVIPAGQSSGLFDITCPAAGSATITATYNSSSAVCAVTVSAPPVGGHWPNEPAGMTVLTDTPFSDSLPAEWFNVYNTEAYASPGGSGTSFSGPRAFDVYLAANSIYGNGQWGIDMPPSREVYMGVYWSTNADFQGLNINTGKMIFIRDPALDNSFLNWYGLQDQPKQLVWSCQTTYSNAHLSNWNGDASGMSGGLAANINNSVNVIAAGTGWHFIELYLKSSTTSTSRDGIVKLWVDNVLSTSVTQANLSPNGFTEMQINPTWDGSVSLGAPYRDMSRAWHHYFDHIYISRKA